LTSRGHASATQTCPRCAAQ